MFVQVIDNKEHYILMSAIVFRHVIFWLTLPFIWIIFLSNPKNLNVFVGMFAIRTDHAAELHRHVEGSMTWTNYAVNLAWLGFADIHSDVTHYFINIGSRYMSADLNAVGTFDFF